MADKEGDFLTDIEQRKSRRRRGKDDKSDENFNDGCRAKVALKKSAKVKIISDESRQREFEELFSLTLITPAPVCANMIQILVHTYRGLGCSIFVEINVKRQSNPLPLKVFNIQHCSAHIQPSTIISKYHFKSVCLLGTTAGVIRVN